MRGFSCALALVFVLTMPLTSLAGPDIPDMKGTWEYDGVGVAHQRPTESPPTLHTGAKPGFFEVHDITMIIDKQEGFQFSGVKVSKHKKEQVSGVIGFDNKAVYTIDDDGFSFGELISPDKMQLIYVHLTEHHSILVRKTLTENDDPRHRLR